MNLWYDPKAERFLERLPRELAKMIVRKVGEAAQTGRGIESLKIAEFGYRIRVGDYRVLIDIEEGTIWVRHNDHRSRVYTR